MEQKNIKCPNCNCIEFWKTKDSRLKCKKCRYLFTYKPNKFNINNELLRQIVSEFVLEHSTNLILQRIKVSKYKLLKILTFLRKKLEKDIPYGIKNEFGLKNEPLPQVIPRTKKEFVIGVMLKDGYIFARILDIKNEEFKSFLKNNQSPILEPWLKDIGIIFRKSFYRLIQKESNKIDQLDSFWGYLKKKMSLKGGVRKEKFHLYLGEYVWRYNNRKLTTAEQEEKIMKLIE